MIKHYHDILSETTQMVQADPFVTSTVSVVYAGGEIVDGGCCGGGGCGDGGGGGGAVRGRYERGGGDV
ncbi:hypothetical protein M0802_009984 [Mischocyttarus mexicanus]|nr:hypothetical protein M0802_009984 [Mischocyttarus mexicanus]